MCDIKIDCKNHSNIIGSGYSLRRKLPRNDKCNQYFGSSVINKIHPRTFQFQERNLQKQRSDSSKTANKTKRTNKLKPMIVKEPKLSTRLEQLSWVPVRRLLVARSEFKNEPTRYEWFSRQIRKGLFSLYTRLSGYRLPSPKPKPKSWTPDEHAYHAELIDRLSKPKQYYNSSTLALPSLSTKKKKNKRKLFSQKRSNELSEPIKRNQPSTSKKQWSLTKKLKEYSATDRIRRLSIPKKSENKIEIKKSDKISKGKSNYKITNRTNNLAIPKTKNDAKDQKSNPFKVSSAALKAKSGVRTNQLAVPRESVRKNKNNKKKK